MNGAQPKSSPESTDQRHRKHDRATCQYLVDDLNPTGYAQVVEEIVSGAVMRQYTYRLQRISENQAISSTWTPSFYDYDGAGSVRQLTNAAGSVTDTYEYDAWGNKINSTGSTPNNYLYRAEQYDSDLGLYYLRARYYNPLTGRFLSRDPEDGKPLDPKTLQKYLYAGGDPVNRADPSGRVLEDYELEDTWIDTTAEIAFKLYITGVCASSIYIALKVTGLSENGPGFVGGALAGGRLPIAPWWLGLAPVRS